MSYTVGQAATATGASKSTISRAISSGRISATKQDDGSYSIEPVELHRVFPPRSRATVADVLHDAPRDPSATGGDASEIMVLQERVAGLRELVRQLEEQNRELNLRLDRAEDERREIRLIAGPVAPVGLFARLFGTR